MRHAGLVTSNPTPCRDGKKTKRTWDFVAGSGEIYCRIAGSLSGFMPPWPPRKCVFCSYLCVLVSVGGHMSLWSRCAVCSPPPAATRDESCVGGGWGSDAGGLWRIGELATCLYGGQVTGRSPFMEVTDVQGDVHQCVCVRQCVCELFSFFFEGFFFFCIDQIRPSRRWECSFKCQHSY